MLFRGTTSFYRTLTNTTFQDTNISLRVYGRTRTYLTQRVFGSQLAECIHRTQPRCLTPTDSSLKRQRMKLLVSVHRFM